MRKTYFLLIIILSQIFSCTTKTEKISCSKYRTGEFKYKMGTNRQSLVYVTRTDFIQTELEKNSGMTGIYRIKWIDSCAYELKYIDGKSNEPEELINLKKRITIKSIIIEGTNNYYIIEASNDMNNMKYRDTIWISR